MTEEGRMPVMSRAAFRCKLSRLPAAIVERPLHTMLAYSRTGQMDEQYTWQIDSGGRHLR